MWQSCRRSEARLIRTCSHLRTLPRRRRMSRRPRIFRHRCRMGRRLCTHRRRQTGMHLCTSPTPPGSASLAVSSPPDEIVPGTDRPPVHTAPIPQGNAAAMRTHVPLAEDPATMAEMVETLSKKAAMLQNIYMDTSGVTFWTEAFHFEFPNPLRASGE